jgi:hypothetical protein
MLDFKCPSCGSRNTEPFFEVKNAPIFSVVTIKSQADALAVPRKDIELHFCNDCAFVFNRLFDPSVDCFLQGYEDQQGYSKTFMQYLTKIAKELIRKYHLTGKTIVEIGCGKGDFLNLMVKLNGGIGIGIDPAYEDNRQKNTNLTFYKELYSRKYGSIPADLIACRHTLEHIEATENFLTEIRCSLGNGAEPLIFFEVPNMKRILEELAFWDIYYEHCSYFSAGSLARVFRKSRYEILDLYLDYKDQYLLIEAKPTYHISNKKFAIEESVEELKLLVERFKTEVANRLGNWRARLIELKEKSSKAVVWGGGSKSVGFLTQFADLDLIEYVVDVNPHMKGNFIPGIGKMYVEPEFLKEYQPDTVIIMNAIYTGEIQQMLQKMGLDPVIYALE